MILINKKIEHLELISVIILTLFFVHYMKSKVSVL